MRSEYRGAMQNAPTYVIIGNGITGVTAAEILRAEDSAATIIVIADDPFPVYYRPALKDYLAGRVHEDKLWARPRSFYQDRTIHFIGERVVGIQARQHLVQLQSGRQIGYQRLLLANGASPARLRCPGLQLQGVTTLRTVADYQKVQEYLPAARRVVVVGSGTLALETVETLRHRGYQVTHLIRKRTLWSEVLDATASDLVLQQERRDGVDVREEEEIAEISGNNHGEVKGITTTGGAYIPCEMVLIAIGIEPNIDFLRASGIPCGRGVKVDNKMRTGVPDIYAAGDVLETTDALTGRTRVIGQWYPSIQQARAATYSMLDLLDTEQPFRASTFYNATFLYGLDFASIGLSNAQGYQEIVADPKPRTYRKVLLKDSIPVGMLSLGDRKQALAFKRAIDHQVSLKPVLSRIFAEDFKLDAWLDTQGVPAPLLGVKRTGDAAVQRAAYNGSSTVSATIQVQPLVESLLVPDPTAAAEFRLMETHLSQTKVITIGRQAGIHLLIDQASVSRRHAEIRYANGQYVLQDLGSTNGTFVNEMRLPPDAPYILKPNDRLRFGNVVKFTFVQRAVEQKKSVSPGSVTMAGITMLHELDKIPSGALGQPVLNTDGSLLLPGATSAIPASVVATFNETPALVVLQGGAAKGEHRQPLIVPLREGKHVTIGRDRGSDIELMDIVVSRKHAEIFPGPDGFYARDLGSSNGVVINQTRISNPYLLSHGDCIRMGSSLIYFIDVRAASGLPVEAPRPRPVPLPTAGLPPIEQVAAASQHHLRICPRCGVANTFIARFCAGCSAPLKA
jgi:NADPH-dependent 2,4-dienoyl-CoA reductase/sulfur reductase-like enzyme/pSer/pThr/pTyr-binding forkhead associated (FHA) protein